ncbi:MAG: hypothetical protein J6M95_01460 [Bacilli bacterium]|nr:hypothetical protein [Bacilli bacterium]
MSNLEKFPDGSVADSWFYQVKTPSLNDFNNKYVISDYGVESNGSLQTNKIQAVIDLAYKNGGGLIIIPKGTYLTGALFFKQNVHLYLDDGATLLGSDDINDYPLIETRIEGETCLYYPGLINADNVDGFIAFGKGVIDGNGLKSWKSFWERRKWNPKCTNKDEQRNRLIYISNSKNILIYGLSFKNSPFWTTHIYKCHHVKFIDLNISSPKEPVPAPSTDGIDIDACKDVLIKGCYFEVNDDGVALKGGKFRRPDNMIVNVKNACASMLQFTHIFILYI